MMPLLGRFRQRYLAVQVDLVVSEDTLNLLRRDADVALRASNRLAPLLVGRRLSGLAWVLYGRAGDGPELAGRDWVVPGDSAGEGHFLRSVQGHAAGDRIALHINTVLGRPRRSRPGSASVPCPAGAAMPARSCAASSHPRRSWNRAPGC